MAALHVNNMELIEYAALYRLGKLASEKIQPIAMDLIESGSDSDYLIDIISESFPIMANVGPLFEKALMDLSVDIPDEEKALSILVNIYCKKILSEDITPFEGAFSIWHEVCILDKAPNNSFEFVGLAGGIQNDGSPKIVGAFNKLIIAEAKKYISSFKV